MTLLEKSVLMYSNDDAVISKTSDAMKPILKSFVSARSFPEATAKAKNQQFDCIILRMNKPILKEKADLFEWMRNQKDYKKTPWIVMGSDVENQEIVIEHNHVKFVEQAEDIGLLLKILQGVFFSPVTNNRIDVNFVNPFVTAISTVLKTMASTELKMEAPFIRKPNQSMPSQADISGIIAMNSNFFLGSMALCFQDSLILKVYERMLGAASATINDEVKDAVCELTNIIFGHAKRDLNALGHTIAAALPSVIVGKNHEVHHSVAGTCICIPFSSPDGTLRVELVLGPKT